MYKKSVSVTALVELFQYFVIWNVYTKIGFINTAMQLRNILFQFYFKGEYKNYLLSTSRKKLVIAIKGDLWPVESPLSFESFS